MDILKESQLLKAKAGNLLHKHGLFKILSKYGNVHVFGSFYLDLMTWEDLDISVEVDDLNINKTFDLLKDISNLLDPTEVKYKNYSYKSSTHGSNGIFVKITDSHIHQMTWGKIDIILCQKQDIEMQIQRNNHWKNLTTEQNRLVILEIKKKIYKHPFYRKEIQSVDIYQAVMIDKVCNYEEFQKWILEQKCLKL